MSLNLSAIPMPDTTSLPSVGEVGEAVSDVVVSAIDTAGDAATVVVETARKRPRAAIGIAAAAVVALIVVMMMRRRRPTSSMTSAEHQDPFAA